MIALVDMGAYWFLDVPLKYAVVLTSIFVPGWITVATLWVLCHYLSAANITDPFNCTSYLSIFFPLYELTRLQIAMLHFLTLKMTSSWTFRLHCSMLRFSSLFFS